MQHGRLENINFIITPTCFRKILLPDVLQRHFVHRHDRTILIRYSESSFQTALMTQFQLSRPIPRRTITLTGDWYKIDPRGFCSLSLNDDFSTILNPKWTVYYRARHGPGEVKLDLSFWPIAADRWGLNLKNPVHEESSLYNVSPRYIGHRFWELAQISAALTVLIERARDRARLKTCHPPHSTRPVTVNQSEFQLAPRRTVDHSSAVLFTPLGGL